VFFAFQVKFMGTVEVKSSLRSYSVEDQTSIAREALEIVSSPPTRRPFLAVPPPPHTHTHPFFCPLSQSLILLKSHRIGAFYCDQVWLCGGGSLRQLFYFRSAAGERRLEPSAEKAMYKIDLVK
jgi:hypothetical protein